MVDDRDELLGRPVTKSQIQIIRLVAEGMKDREIAEVLTIEPRTVSTQLSYIYRRLGFSGRNRLTVWAVCNGIAEI